MTIRELMRRCTIEEIMPHIAAFQYKQLAMRPYYREARDILLNIEAEDTYEGIPVTNNDGRPWVMMCEGNPWRSLVDSPLEIDEDVHCTDAQLAAQCLWHLTFYRFAPDAPSPFDDEDEDYDDEPTTRRGRITKLINSLEVDNPKELDYLYRTTTFCVHTYHSRAYDLARRLPYLVETMTHYAMPSRHPKWQLGFVLLVDPQHDLTEEEKKMYHDLVETLSVNRTLKVCCIGKQDSLGIEAELLVIESKPRK